MSTNCCNLISSQCQPNKCAIEFKGQWHASSETPNIILLGHVRRPITVEHHTRNRHAFARPTCAKVYVSVAFNNQQLPNSVKFCKKMTSSKKSTLSPNPLPIWPTNAVQTAALLYPTLTKINRLYSPRLVGNLLRRGGLLAVGFCSTKSMLRMKRTRKMRRPRRAMADRELL